MKEEKLIEELRLKLECELPGLSSQLKAAPPFRAGSFTERMLEWQEGLLWFGLCIQIMEHGKECL